MSNHPTFVAHALDLLALVGPVQARAMFGGHGLYAGGVMFGLLDDDELFLKTDDATRARFVEAGCRMWVYPRMPQTNYYRPPDEAHESAEAMLPWGRLGLEAALRAAAAKLAKAKPAKAKRAPAVTARAEGTAPPRRRRSGGRAARPRARGVRRRR